MNLLLKRLVRASLHSLIPPESGRARLQSIALRKVRQCRKQVRREYYVVRNRSIVVIEVPLNICVSPLGFLFGPHGWHHLLDLLREYDCNPTLRPEDSALRRFYERYIPSGTEEMLDHLGYDARFRPGFFVYPWGNFRTDYSPTTKRAKSQLCSRFCGPAEEWRLQSDFDQTIRLYKQIKRYGYHPWIWGFIGGVTLRRSDGQERFVVLEGNHRLAVLAYLGIRQVKVSYLQKHHHVICENSVQDWYHVRNGECSIADALAYFNAFFRLTGCERLEQYRLREGSQLDYWKADRDNMTESVAEMPGIVSKSQREFQPSPTTWPQNGKEVARNSCCRQREPRGGVS